MNKLTVFGIVSIFGIYALAHLIDNCMIYKDRKNILKTLVSCNKKNNVIDVDENES